MTIPTMKTLKEAAQITGLSYDYLRKLCLQGKIVYVRAGNKFLLNMEKLVEFLNQGEKKEDESKQAMDERNIRKMIQKRRNA